MRRAPTWRACWQRIARSLHHSLAALALVALCASGNAASAATDPNAPNVSELLTRYSRAIADPGAPTPDRLESQGTIVGAGLQGTFHTWLDGDRERDDQSLGPRRERTLRLGDRVYFADADGNVREFTGVLLRRARTQRFIDSGDFANAPERCTYRGSTTVDGGRAYALDVASEGGEIETVYLDATTSLPRRVAFDDDDGRTTIDFSDWRTVNGRRFAFRATISDGEHSFDTVQSTTSLALNAPIEPAVFAPLVARAIEMSAAETIALTMREGHLYVPVHIAGHTYRFLVDTGAQNILIDRRVATELGLHPQGALEVSGAGRSGGLQVAELPELEVGSGRLRNLIVTTLDLGASTGGAFRIDGILGYPFFAAATVRIDASALAMTFGPPGSMIVSGERLPLEIDRAVPETRLRLNGSVDAPFLVDTGNAGELLLYRPFVDRHPGIVPVTLAERNSYGIGGTTSSYRTWVDELDFGQIPLYHAGTDVMLATRGAFADRFDAGNVGLGLLKNFVVTFDESRAALYLERSAAFRDGRDG